MLTRRLLLVGTLALAGCTSLPRPEPYPATGPYPELEPVRLIRIGPQDLSLEVASRGCGVRPDLTFFVERRGGVATVAFARRRMQTCRDTSEAWVEVVFSRKALGLSADEPVFLLNPLAVRPDR